MEVRAPAIGPGLINPTLGQGDAASALAASLAYQNANGGFGRGLEPDVSGSAPSDHPMMQGVVGRLEANFDWKARVWPIIGPEVALAPHASWWTWSQDMHGSEQVTGAGRPRC